jgi:hypothetical protein
VQDNMRGIQIVDSPLGSPMETVFGIVLMVRSPRSERSVTVMVNPAAIDYQEHPVDTPELQVRGAFTMGYTEETAELFFDLDGAPTHRVTIGGKQYEIRLMGIGKQDQEGQSFPMYDFLVQAM